MTRPNKRDFGRRLGVLEDIQAAKAPPRTIHMVTVEPGETADAAISRAGLDPTTPAWSASSKLGPSIITFEPPAFTELEDAK